MKRLLPLTIAAAFVINTGVQSQIPDLEGVKILTTHVSGNIYMLEATGDVAGNIGIVQQKKAAGMNLEQIKKEGFPSKYDSWGKGYTNARKWIENIFYSLEDINTKKSMPEDVLKIQKKAKKVYFNEKGFWEAEFKDKIIMVYIPEGEFPMGSDNGLDNEKPVHKVYLDGYWLAKYPVTVGQFKKFINDTGYITDAEKGQGSWQWWKSDWVIRPDGNWKNPYYKQGDDHPVVSVSWNDANEYCKWLSHRTRLDFKLPTAAQWEKGARGTDERMYPWGNEKPDGTKANYADINYWNKYKGARHPDKNIDDGFTETSPVGNYLAGASPFGLLDMAGNVWEWCYDIYDNSYYSVSPYRNPLGPPDAGKADQARVNRGGGSWTDRSGYLTPAGGHNLRSAARTGDEQNSSDDHMGFRLCIDNISR